MTGVLQRINDAGKILQTNPWIKDMSNSQFKSVDIDQIRREVGKAETEAGLVVVYTELEFSPFPMGGKTFNMVKADLTYYSIDDEAMENGVVFHRSAIGFDSLDKGFNKAESMLYKNHYKGLYHIGERADDPDQYSKEEYELIEAYRYAAKHHKDGQKDDMLMSFTNLVSEAQRKMAAEAKRQKMESAAKDSFFRTGAEVAADAQEEPAADEWAVKVKACKKSILDWIKEDPTQRTTNEILVHYVNAHGTMSTWEGGTVVQCYKELRSAGVEGLPEVAL